MLTSIVTDNILKDRKIAYAITDCNLTVVQTTGLEETLCLCPKNVCVGQSILEILPELLGSEEMLAQILAGKLPRGELVWVNRVIDNGHVIYLNLVSLPFCDPHGQIVGLIQLVQDVTELGEINQQLAQHRNDLRLLQTKLACQNKELTIANEELQHLADMKTTFISVTAHELRSPLTSIYGFMGLLLDETYGPFNQEQRESLEVVQQSAIRLKSIVDDLLITTQIETGRIELILQPTDLTLVVKLVAAELQPQLEKKSLHLKIKASSHLPNALCDSTRTVQIILNLVNNAVKYTRANGEISVTVVKSATKGFLQVEVSDTGIGINLQEKPKIFKRFSRLSNVSQTGAAGVGLGLYIARSLVELHGGSIWFDSLPNKGTTFYVTFPIADA